MYNSYQNISTCNVTISGDESIMFVKNRTEQEQKSLGLPSGLHYFLLIFLSLLLLVGVMGNVLTLLALPYVRRKYGAQFSVLQSSTAILLFHLSLCDLIYISVGFTHFIHVLIVGKGIIIFF